MGWITSFFKFKISSQKPGPSKAREEPPMQPLRAYSLAGPLSLKQYGALSLLRPKRRYFFVLDELGKKLVYYKDEQEFLQHKDEIGSMSLEKTAFAIVEGNDNAFLAYVGERQFELEADNRTSCESWMEALANRDITWSPEKNDSELGGSSTADYDTYYSYAPDIIKPSLRKLSENPSSGSNLALSVLEEKLHRLSLELAGEHNGITPSMNDWVGNWLQKHNYTITDSLRSNSISSASSSNEMNGQCSVFDSEQEEQKSNEELVHLRMVSNQQKVRMHELKMENKALEEQNNILREKASTLTETSTSRFLNTEVARLNKKCMTLEDKLVDTTERLKSLQTEMQLTRKEYVFALQSAIRIPLHDNNSLEVMQVKLIGGDVHRRRVCTLVNEARSQDPSLPTLHSLLAGVHVDSYGFRQHFENESLAVQYMATQLYMFYESNEEKAKTHKAKWKQYIRENETISITPETRSLCRGGVPNGIRATVWHMLVHLHTTDLKQKYGRYYFKSLCNRLTEEEHDESSPANLKQINLDLLRTMPSNVHFMAAHCKGVSQLQVVLRTFCLHNSKLGYCQGMNFLAATALLFLTPEDSFWFLVAMTEKYFDVTYFDANLTGAQADQEVLKELLEWRHPTLAAHLAKMEVDLTTITLNWFIAVFFDAVPFQTLLRIWDCFLLEGPKVLFRFALVLLGHHEQEILSRHDTIGVIKVIKAAVKLCYDVDGLFQKAFCDMRGLPSRAQLRQKHNAYLQVLQEKLSKREQIRNLFIKTPSLTSEEVTITDVVPSEVESGLSFIVSGNQTLGLISKVIITDKKATLVPIDIEFDCRVASLVAVDADLIFVGLISAYVIAVELDGDKGEILWEMKLPDTALRLRCLHEKLFCSLANGTITVLENVIAKTPAALDMYHIPLGAAPLNEAVPMGESLWVTSGCKISVVDVESLDNMSTFFVACSTAGGSTPFFEKILCACRSEHGVFLTTAHSTLVQLWTEGTCRLLFDIAFDHRTRKPSLSSDDEITTTICSLCFVDGFLWVGTSDGYVIIYSIEHGVPDAQTNKFGLRRYPPGKRLNPESSPGGQNIRSQLCYIPTAEEAEEEEQLSRNEYPKGRRTSKVSINIDQSKKEYSVYLTENNNEEKKMSESNRTIIRRRSSATASWMVHAKKNFQKGVSSDSVFMPDPISEQPIKKRLLHSTGSSNQSMEYDSDIFELYSDEEKGRAVYAMSPRKTWDSTPKSWERPLIKRKDLTFDETLLIAVPEDGGSSTGEETPRSGGSLTISAQVETSVELTLAMKLKISDRPVRRVVPCQTASGPVVISCSGCMTDDEALLVWRKDKESSLWINDPIYGPSCKIPQKQSSLEKKKSNRG